MEDLKTIIESLLFVAQQPVTLESLKGLFPSTETRVIRATLKALVEEYDTNQRGFYLKEIAGGFQFRSRPEYREYIKRFTQTTPPRLSRAALETLAIVAYKQPIIRADIEHIRGVDSGGVLRMLMERKLIRVLGRKEIPGRPLIYATTKKFLEVFDLKDLKDLPSPKEIAELSQSDGEENDTTIPDLESHEASVEDSQEDANPGVEEESGSIEPIEKKTDPVEEEVPGSLKQNSAQGLPDPPTKQEKT
jgi:segregation and condensation protein B